MAKKKRAEEKTPATRANGPYLALAVLCENVLEDKDGVMSLIRIVEMFKIQIRSVISGELVPAAAMPYFLPPVSFQIMIGLKAGNAKGHRKLKIIPKTPSGQAMGETSIPITLDSPKEPRGANLRIPMNLMVKEEGVYWIDVLLNEQLLTRIPLRVEFETVESTSTKSSSGS